jgi:hypothetical protein
MVMAPPLDEAFEARGGEECLSALWGLDGGGGSSRHPFLFYQNQNLKILFANFFYEPFSLIHTTGKGFEKAGRQHGSCASKSKKQN